MNDKIKNKNEPLSAMSEETDSKKDPTGAKSTETEPVLLIDIDVYCSSLDPETNKFAKTIIQGAVNAGKVPAKLMSREDWETIYLKLKNS